MSWTSTLAIYHGESEDPRELRSSLVQDGRRCLTATPGASVAGVAESDLVVLMPGVASIGAPALRREWGSRTLVLALTERAAPWADAVLHPQTVLKQIADRVNALIRLSVLEAEAEARLRTLGESGLKLDQKLPKPPAKIRALYIGGPSKEFGSLQDSLERGEIELRPVLRPTLALDEIENGLIDAIVLDASISPQEARELSLLLRRNSDLALSPVVVLDAKAAYAGRAPSLLSDVLRGALDVETVTTRVRQLVSESRRRRQALALLRRVRMKEAFDAKTGLSTCAFLEGHVNSHVRASEADGRALAAGVLKVAPMERIGEQEVQALNEHIGSLIARLIRAEDSAARLSPDTVAILFPATAETSAHSALKRIAAVLGATRFHANRHADGLTLNVEWQVFSPKAGDGELAGWLSAPDRFQASRSI